MKVVLIGYGQLARARARAWRRHVDLTIVYRTPPSAPLKGVRWLSSSDCIQKPPAADIIVWAVRPQQMAEALATYLWPKQQPMLSVAAALYAADLKRLSPRPYRWVRSMPNWPVQVGAGLTGLWAPPAVKRSLKPMIDTLFMQSGQVLWVKSEAQLDALTAISGTGPGYLFAWAEAWQHVATANGFSPTDAALMVRQTLVGTVQLLQTDTRSFTQLADSMRLPAGITNAGLEKLAQNQALERLVQHTHKAGLKQIQTLNRLSRVDKLTTLQKK